MIPLFAAVPSPAPLLGARMQATAVRLFRGAPISLAPGLTRYYDEGEAVLDSKDSEIPQPLEYAAATGPQRAFLIRFGSLDAVLPIGAKIESATLRLKAADGQPVEIRSIRQVLVPWKSAGPTSLSARLRKDVPEIPRQSATWSVRRLGQKWSRAGAQSDADSAPIVGATFAPDGTVSGITATVQGMADTWWTNGGFLVEFKSEALLGSALSPTGRPELEISYSVPASDAPSSPDLAAIGRAGDAMQVANLGASPSTAYRVRAIVDGRPGEWSTPQVALAGGATADVELPKVFSAPAGTRVILEVEGHDANPRNDAVETILGGKPVLAPTAARAPGVARAVRLWNAAAEASRYGFAPDGATARLTFVGVGDSTLPDETTGAIFPALSALAGIPETASLNRDAARMPRIPDAPARGAEDRYPGLSGGGDSRGEASVMAQTDLLNEPVDDPLLRRLGLEGSGALSLYDVAALNAGGEPPVPRGALLQARNASGRPLIDQSLAIYTGDGASFDAVPAATLKTNGSGIVVLPAAVLTAKILAIVATANGETEVGYLKGTRIRGAAARGNIAPLLTVRLNLPTLPVVRDGSLAGGKFINDSLNSAANVLGLAIDGNPSTQLRATYEPNGTIEIDLGRDRTVAEVAIRATAMPARFDLRLRGTGEDPAGSTLWASEGDWPWTLRNRPDAVSGGTGVLYRGTAQRGRYLRIVFPDGGDVALNEILVYAAKVAG